MERIILFSLLLLLPTQLAYHFWPQSSYVYGLRVDYLSPAIYLTDLLIFLLLPYIKKRLCLFLFPVLLFALLNCIFAQTPAVALWKWVIVFKLLVLGLYFYSCDLKKLKKTVVSALSLSLITVFIIGLAQFVLQKTIGGPLYYLGERNFTSLTPGISLMTVFGKSLMRAYSTFSHPNSFAGFVVVSFLILMSFKKQPFLYLILILSLLITFSLNALVGILFVVFLFFVMKNNSKLVHKMKAVLVVFFISLSFAFGIFSTKFPKNNVLPKHYQERVVLAASAIKAFSVKPVFGVGLNNFFNVTKNNQPPHNVYLIIFSETGIVGTLIVFLLFSKLLKRKINQYLLLAIFFMMITGLFDHYWLTLQQNQLVLSVLLGLAARKEYSNNLYEK